MGSYGGYYKGEKKKKKKVVSKNISSPQGNSVFSSALVLPKIIPKKKKHE